VTSAAAMNLNAVQSDPLERKPPASELGSRPPRARYPLPGALEGNPNNLASAESNQAQVLLTTQERLLTAREVAARLGVSERWVRDHTTRRSPKIRAIKLGTLIRYRRIDVENFVQNLSTERTFSQSRFGV
jgi:excisionase family DNA binding protein